jgi:hypothetical protein
MSGVEPPLDIGVLLLIDLWVGLDIKGVSIDLSMG